MNSGQLIGRDISTGQAVRAAFENGIITAVEESEGDCSNYISSGFIDLQVNGYAGYDLNAEQISVDTVLGLVNAMLATGVTCFVPTLITAPEEALCASLQVIGQALKLDRRAGHGIPFIHVEGPHISSLDGYRGAHPANAVRPPSIDEFDRWQIAAGGLIGIVTISPHFAESSEYISALTSRGVHVSIGHTHASHDQIKRAVDAGARLSTHLGNGIVAKIPRHRNPIWAQLAEDRLTATFIADGHHLPADVFKAMLRAKGMARSVLVSDAVALAGMPSGEYSTPVGGHVELNSDGRLCMYGTDLLAGSTASLAQCIGRAMQMAGLTLAEAIELVTVNPGRFVGGRGQLEVGSRADLVRFDFDGEVAVHDVWLAGEHVFAKKA